MPRLELLSEVQRSMLQMFPCMEHDGTPWTRMRKPLSESKVALVTSAGLHLRDDKPFVMGGDSSYRVLPSSTPVEDILQSHASIGFDHTGIYRDINVTYPVDRVRELADQGVIGSLGENNYSFMGALRDTSEVVEQTGPEVARKLVNEGVEVAFLTPT